MRHKSLTFAPPHLYLNYPKLPTEPRLQFDSTITGIAAAAEKSETALGWKRLPETARTKISNRRTEIDRVEKIAELQTER